MYIVRTTLSWFQPIVRTSSVQKAFKIHGFVRTMSVHFFSYLLRLYGQRTDSFLDGLKRVFLEVFPPVVIIGLGSQA